MGENTLKRTNTTSQETEEVNGRHHGEGWVALVAPHKGRQGDAAHVSSYRRLVRQEPLRRHHAVHVQLAHVHEALQPGRELHERAERLDGYHLAIPWGGEGIGGREVGQNKREGVTTDGR